MDREKQTGRQNQELIAWPHLRHDENPLGGPGGFFLGLGGGKEGKGKEGKGKEALLFLEKKKQKNFPFWSLVADLRA